MPRQQSAKNTREENIVAAKLGGLLGLTFHRYGVLDHIDWWIEKNDKCVALAELKRRYNDSSKYPTVFLSIRKWSEMLLLSSKLNVDAFFIVKFNDQIMSINISKVDASKHTVGGRKDRTNMTNDIEPLILVPISDMSVIGKANAS